jgi:hypothetical protein
VPKNADFGIVFCGGGPAALGPFVCAARKGSLDELLDQGVLVIERGTALGGGSLRHYAVSSNSLAVAFLEGLDEVPLGGPLDDVRDDPATLELRKLSGVHAPLKVAGAFLDSVGAAVTRILERHPKCAVLRETTVTEVSAADDRVSVSTLNGEKQIVRAGKAVIALGGRAPDGLESLELVPGLSLRNYADKLRHASAVFDERIGLPTRLVEAVGSSGKVAVVGGSHSAWSVAGTMLNDPRFRGQTGAAPMVTLLHRSPIRLFYLTAEEAKEERYPFDPERDVCPVSGRVNRVGGLKGDARDLARRALGFADEGVPIRLLRVGPSGDRRATAAALDEAELVVAATGYRPRLPEILAHGGRVVEPARSSSGIAVTDRAELVAANGDPVANVLTYGLGVGIRAPERIGGEPSNQRAITSVWLYQHDVGDMALGSLLGEEDVEAHSVAPPALTPGALGSGF